MNKKRFSSLLVLSFFILSLFSVFQFQSVKAVNSDSTNSADTITCETTSASNVKQNWIFSKVTVDSKDYWILKNKNTSKCLSYYLDSNNAEVIAQLPYVEGDSKQLWDLYLKNSSLKGFNVINKENGKYLELGNGATTVAGDGVRFANAHMGGSTLFYFNGVTSIVNGSTYHMQSIYPNFGIQGNGDAFVNSFAVTAQASNSQQNQQWKIDKITTVNSVDYYTFTNAFTQKVLTYNGLFFTQDDYVAGIDEQLWAITFSGLQGNLIINKKTDGNIVLANGLNNAPGGLKLFLKTTVYDTNGYGQFLFNGATTFESGSTYTVKSYYPGYYLNAEGTRPSSDETITADTITCETTSASNVKQNWIFTKVTVDSTDYWILKNKNTLKCLSYYLDSNNAEVIAQLPYVEGDSKQLWSLNLYNPTNKYFNLINKANNKYLQLGNGASTVAGNGLKFATSHVGGSTAFYFNGVASFVNGSTYHMQSVSPQFGIQGNGDAFVNSFAVTAQASNSQLNQQWKIDKITTVNSVDYYTFTNAFTQKVLTYNSLFFTQEDYAAGKDEQLWAITFSGLQGNLIINKKTDGNIVLANGLNDTPGGLKLFLKTTVYDTNGYGQFLFNGATTFESGSTYTIKSYYPQYYLNADGSQSSGGTGGEVTNFVKLNTKNNLNSQKWIIESVLVGESTYYKITSYYSNKLLTVTPSNDVVEADSKAVNGVESDFQLWNFELRTNRVDHFAIISKYNGNCLTVQNSDQSLPGDNLVLADIAYSVRGSAWWLVNDGVKITDGKPHVFRIYWPLDMYLTSIGKEYERPAVPTGDEVYYVSSSSGNDNNDGLSENAPFKTVAKLNTIALKAGNKVLLKKDDIFTDGLNVNGVGTSTNWITVSSYGNTGNNPIIKVPKDTVGIYVYSTSYIDITNIDIEAGLEVQEGKPESDAAVLKFPPGNGILAELSTNVKITNCNVKGSRNTGFGILIKESHDYENKDKTNIVIRNCSVDGTVMGISTSASSQFTVINCKAVNIYCWGMGASFSFDGLFYNCTVDNVGFGENEWGNCGMIASNSQRIDFDHCYMHNIQRGPQMYDGCGFDFEGGSNNQSDIRLINSVIDGIDGSGVFLFDNNQNGGNANFLMSNNIIKNFGRNAGRPDNKAGFQIARGNAQTHSSGVVMNNIFMDDGNNVFYANYPADVKNVSFLDNDFISRPFKTDLNKYIETALAITRTNESDIVWKEFQSSIINAKNVYNNPDSTMEQISDAILFLRLARIDLGTYNYINSYKLDNITLKDYTSNTDNTPIIIPTETAPVITNGIYDNITKEALEKLIASTSESVVTINTKKADVLTADMLKALKDAGKTLRINIVDEGGAIQFVWIFDTIENVGSDVDLSLNAVSDNYDKIMKIVGGKTSQIVSIKNLNALPGKTRVIILNSAGFKANDLLNLYSYNSNLDKIELLSERVSISKDEKYLSFELKQGSDIVISSFSQISGVTQPKSESPNYNVGLIILFIIIGIVLIGGAVFLFFFFKKKKEI